MLTLHFESKIRSIKFEELQYDNQIVKMPTRIVTGHPAVSAQLYQTEKLC